MNWIRRKLAAWLSQLGSIVTPDEGTGFVGTLWQVETKNEHLLISARGEDEVRSIVRKHIGTMPNYLVIKRLDPLLTLNLQSHDSGANTAMNCARWAWKYGPGIIADSRR